MIDLGQKVVLAAGAGQSCAQLGITQGATKSREPADDPEHHDDRRGLNVDQLKTEAREHSGADHIGNDDSGGNLGRVV